jgi:hypothetical protein
LIFGGGQVVAKDGVHIPEKEAAQEHKYPLSQIEC